MYDVYYKHFNCAYCIIVKCVYKKHFIQCTSLIEQLNKTV